MAHGSFLAILLFLETLFIPIGAEYVKNEEMVINLNQKPSFVNRIKSDILDYVTPQMFGAKGNGYADDTAPIQRAINYASRKGIKEVRVPSGTYNINISGKDKKGGTLFIDGESHYFDLIGVGLMMKSNVNFILDNEAVLRAVPTDLPEYALLYVGEQHDIKICGGKIIGDAVNHLGTKGQHGMCVWIQSSRSIVVDGCDISQGWGDCIDIGCKWNNSIKPGSNRSRDISVINCELHDSRRQGISVVGCEKLLVKNCHIYNIAGDAPAAGIDLEVNFSDYPNIDCQFDGVSIENCKGGGLIGYTTPTNGVKIKNSIIQSVQLTCAKGIEIEKSTIDYVTLDNSYDTLNDSFQLRDTEIKTLTLFSSGRYDLFIDNCTIGNDNEQPALAFLKRQEGRNMEKVVNILIKDSRLLADNNINLFSISQSIYPNTLMLDNCKCTFYRSTSIFANHVELNNCSLSGRSLTIDFFVPSVSMMNNTIDTKECRENINGYIYKFRSAGRVIFSGNKMIGDKKEAEYVVIPRDFTPECVIMNNEAPQYYSISSYSNKEKVRAGNNKLKTR